MGERGFTLNARGGEGAFGPALDCFYGCLPGQTVDLGARWGGLDLNGTATLDGVTYDHIGGANDDAAAGVMFTASFVVPAVADAFVDVTTPFQFSGWFMYGTTGTGFGQESLRGSGMVTTRFRRSDVLGTPAYVPERTLYTFTPVPEPATWLLVTVGGALLAGSARVRRSLSGRARLE